MSATVGLEFQRLKINRYKCFGNEARLDIAPLTILVGPNNSGKSALARAIQLLAGGLDVRDPDNDESLPLVSGGVRHGNEFADLITGCAIHGKLSLAADFMANGQELSISVIVQNVERPPLESVSQIDYWLLQRGDAAVEIKRDGTCPDSKYRVSSSWNSIIQDIDWRGLIPISLDGMPDWFDPSIKALKDWGRGVLYVKCPRTYPRMPFTPLARPPRTLGPNGSNTPQLLAADAGLAREVNKWCQSVFGVKINVASQGRFRELMVESPLRTTQIRLEQSGRGVAQVLPVLATALMSGASGPGVDIIEHPEAELHPASHAEVVELMLENLAGASRPLIVETHSPMIVLRARRWVVEQRIQPADVVMYWINSDRRNGYTIEKIQINERGELDNWPAGVFAEDYAEILAMRRALRKRNSGSM